MSRGATLWAALAFGAVGAALAQEAAPEAATETPPDNATEPAPDPASAAAVDEPKPEPKKDKPWRLADHLPDWLHIDGTHRTRFAYVFNQFRAGNPGDNRLVSLRTTARLELRFKPVILGAELMDSRAYGADDEAPLNTGIVNAAELLQAYLKLDLGQFLPEGNELFVRAGRLTIDFGSRRLQARNRFRNTINALTGFEFKYTRKDGLEAHGFVGSPIQRRPSDAQSLDDNDVQLDREHEDVINWGLGVTSPRFTDANVQAMVYVIGLHEQDSARRPTRNRELYTPGVRLWSKKARGQFDGRLEAAYQWGRSRSSGSPNNRTRLQHRAFFIHATLAYTFDHEWSPRLAFNYDWASGDQDPTDGDNGRFDTLFGARRFELGATGIFGAFARNNIHSPGVRLDLQPHTSVKTFVTYRAFWLHHDRDAWTAAGVRDTSGDSGRFVGHLLDARVRWEVFAGNLRLEAGAAAVIRGRFARDAPNSNSGGEPVFLYTQVLLRW